MSLNSENRFAWNPVDINIQRSKFNRPQRVITSFNLGRVIPTYIDEVLPGDSMHIKTNMVVRMPTLLTPFMDNIDIATYYFFVPMRLCWEHTKQFFGENTNGSWIPTDTYQIPQITSPSTYFYELASVDATTSGTYYNEDGTTTYTLPDDYDPDIDFYSRFQGWKKGTIADYLGIPTKVPNLSVNALPFRAVALCMNEWFRDQNLTDYLNIPVNDSTQTGTNGDSYINDIANGGMPFKAAKIHDYFTSALPGMQKGQAVSLSINDLSATASTDVYGNGKTLGLTDNSRNFGLHAGWNNSTDGKIYGTTGSFNKNQGDSGGLQFAYGNKSLGLLTKEQIQTLGEGYEDATGIEANTNVTIQGQVLTTISELRTAFQIQKFYERQSLGGSRYIEIIKSMFGTTNPDYRLQRPEFLGGNKFPINVYNVAQTSSTDSTSAQGNITGYSQTANVHDDFFKSFTEHGFVLGFTVARINHHTYQNGIERMWNRKTNFDFYWPLFSQLSEQAILNKEIYAQGSGVINPSTSKAYDDEVFGYQERYAEYRYKPNRVCGEMRSNYAQSLDTWHLADDYNSLPVLSDAWIREDQSNVNRVLAVQDKLADQFFADILIENESTRPMPLYSVPGLIDHH